MRTFDNTSNTINSRDIIERIEELEAQQEELVAQLSNGEITEADMVAFDKEEGKELDILRALADECKNCSDWAYGELLIRETHFTDYIKEWIHDCYELHKELTSGEWPYRHITIDYEAAAKEDKCNYTEVDFDGVTYLIRS